CSVSEICQAGLQLTRELSSKRKQQVSFSTNWPEAQVLADARRLKQMLVNLLSNAIKFTPESGKLGIEVTGDPDEQVVKITVWDHGIGIESRHMGRLFKSFTQIDGTLARQYGGTGLGLSLTSRLAELHNGGIQVESKPGLGSRFTLSLPMLPQDQPAEQRPDGGPSSPIEPGSPRAAVAVVDDSEASLLAISAFLSSQNYRVSTYNNGYEFLDGLADARPDLVLMDIQMPGLDGLETIQRLRAHADLQLANMPVIALTALAMPGDRERCLAAGANDYISKPAQLRQLSAAIAALLDQHRSTPVTSGR
ncbi:MAG: response regulator, partial [Chloroflexota bacterium]